MDISFRPLFRNPHLATIAGNFWRRPESSRTVAETVTRYRISQNTTIVALQQVPEGPLRGHLVILHGLEGSAAAGYARSLSGQAVELGYATHRLNFRTCGGSESLSTTMYHSGLSSDTDFIVRTLVQQTSAPVFLVGFSLGGNVALKLTGEYGRNSLLRGTVAVSAPIDLAQCVKEIDKPANRIYADRFLSRLKSRIRRKSILSPETYSAELLRNIDTIWQFDDLFTAPLFGFGNAANYYATQSSLNYIAQISSPTLLIAAEDDPLVPFQMYQHSVITGNAAVRLLAPKHGGHVGFLSRTKPRFWIDSVVMNWIQALAEA